jgi:hypothetical protein
VLEKARITRRVVLIKEGMERGGTAQLIGLRCCCDGGR